MSTSGGIVYHLRALRYGSQEWVHHRNSVFNFLEQWIESQKRPRTRTLVIVGSSGGYSLSEAILHSFDELVIYEPDFLARMIFQFRFRKVPVKITWIKSKYDFKSPLPEGAILFCNLLGQIEIKNFKEFKADLHRVLTGREWASFHDALSGEHIRFRVPSFAHAKIDATQIQSWIQTRHTRPVQAIAHLAPDLFEDGDFHRFFYWDWRITAKRTHLIEGVFHGAKILA